MFRRFIQTAVTERVVVTIILLNTLAIMLRGFEWWRSNYEMALFAIDYTCTVFFVLEMGVKIGLTGWRRYWAESWNRFDFIIIILSSPMLLTPVLDLHELTVILVLRTGRCLRFFRLLRFVPDRDRVWSGVLRGLKAAIGVALALALYNVTLAIAANYLFGNVAPEHFGNPLLASYSLFKVFTIEGWYEIPEVMARGMPPMAAGLTKAFFVGAVLTGGILGLSMANAIFVDEMVLDNNQGIEVEIKELREKLDALTEQHAAEMARVSAALEALVAQGAAAPPTETDVPSTTTES
jgi:voltage-gated sodium channel